MRPESGFSKPRASFRISVFPVPATPIRIFVSPCGSWNEMPSSTGWSKAMATSSKRMTDWSAREAEGWRCSKGGARIGMVR